MARLSIFVAAGLAMITAAQNTITASDFTLQANKPVTMATVTAKAPPSTTGGTRTWKLPSHKIRTTTVPSSSATSASTTTSIPKPGAHKRRDSRGWMNHSRMHNQKRDTTFPIDTSNTQCPSGYTQTFSSVQGSVVSNTYSSWQRLTSYDPSVCAASCDSSDKCAFFNIYYEKGKNSNGDIVDYINCGYFTASQNRDAAWRKGQRALAEPLVLTLTCFAGGNINNYQTTVTGSNGCAKNGPAQPSGQDPTPAQSVAYSPATSIPTNYTLDKINDAVVKAPLYDTTGQITLLKYVELPVYSTTMCAKACDDQTAANQANPDSNGGYQACVFANLYRITTSDSTTSKCDLYTQVWNGTYALKSATSDASFSMSVGLTNTELAKTYPKLSGAPKTLGPATLGSTPGGAGFGFGFFGGTAVGATAYTQLGKVSGDSFAFYTGPGQVNGFPSGWLYHVDSGLCVSVAQTQETVPFYKNGYYSLATCDFSGTLPPFPQIFILDGDDTYDNRLAWRVVFGGGLARGDFKYGLEDYTETKAPAVVGTDGEYCIVIPK